MNCVWPHDKWEVGSFRLSFACVSWMKLIWEVVSTEMTPLLSKFKGGSKNRWWSKNRFISEIFSWTPTHGHASISWPAKTYIYDFGKDIWCCLVDVPSVMADRDGWWESKESVLSVCFWWLVPQWIKYIHLNCSNEEQLFITVLFVWVKWSRWDFLALVGWLVLNKEKLIQNQRSIV